MPTKAEFFEQIREITRYYGRRVSSLIHWRIAGIDIYSSRICGDTELIVFSFGELVLHREKGIFHPGIWCDFVIQQHENMQVQITMTQKEKI